MWWCVGRGGYKWAADEGRGGVGEPIVPLQDGMCVLLLLTFPHDLVLAWKEHAGRGV